MPGFGVDRRTGKMIGGLEHAVQCLVVLFTTGIGSRIMRRTVGSQIPPLLGRNITQSTFLRFATAVHIAVQLWEPRIRVIQVTFPESTNSAGSIRSGRVGFALLAQYRPRGHLGDMTVEGGTRILLI